MFFNKEKKVELFNPLEAKVGSTVVVDVIDLRTQDLTVKELLEYTRTIDSKEFQFTDYVLNDSLRLRAMPDFCMSLTLFDEFEFNEDFLGVVEDACNSTFNLDDERAEFVRCNKLTTPYVAQIKTLANKISEISYWDFSRQAVDEAGYEYTDFVIIEKNDESGWFQLWRGQELLRNNIKVV